MIKWFKKFRGVSFFFVVMCALANCSVVPFYQMPIKTKAMITLETKNGPTQFSLEIADTPHARLYGLMERASMPLNHGMLFVFDKTARHAFWMKNTKISLDLIFFDENLKIVGFIEEAEPMNLTQLIIDQPSRYVLEVLAGTVKKYGINLHTRGSLRYD